MDRGAGGGGGGEGGGGSSSALVRVMAGPQPVFAVCPSTDRPLDAPYIALVFLSYFINFVY